MPSENIARGSALECAACLDVSAARKTLAEGLVRAGKTRLVPIVSMLMGLTRSVRSQVREDAAEYEAWDENERDQD